MSKLLSVSVPDDLLQETQALADARGTTKSELVRDALRKYVQLARFRSIQAHGRGQAERAGIGPEDVEPLVDELRAGRSGR